MDDPGRLAAERSASESGPGMAGGDHQIGRPAVEVLADQHVGVGNPPEDMGLDLEAFEVGAPSDVPQVLVGIDAVLPRQEHRICGGDERDVPAEASCPEA